MGSHSVLQSLIWLIVHGEIAEKCSVFYYSIGCLNLSFTDLPVIILSLAEVLETTLFSAQFEKIYLEDATSPYLLIFILN